MRGGGERDEGTISVQNTGDQSPNQVLPLEVQILEAARGWALCLPTRPVLRGL